MSKGLRMTPIPCDASCSAIGRMVWTAAVQSTVGTRHKSWSKRESLKNCHPRSWPSTIMSRTSRSGSSRLTLSRSRT